MGGGGRGMLAIRADSHFMEPPADTLTPRHGSLTFSAVFQDPTFLGGFPTPPTHHCTGQLWVTQPRGSVSRCPHPPRGLQLTRAGRWSRVKRGHVVLEQPWATVRGDLANDTDQGLQTQGGQGLSPSRGSKEGCLPPLPASWGPRHFRGRPCSPAPSPLFCELVSSPLL